jgi:hypothetical protein
LELRYRVQDTSKGSELEAQGSRLKALRLVNFGTLDL